MKSFSLPCLMSGLVAGLAVLVVARPAAAEGTESPKIHKNTIKWATASEVENFGFDVYRGESEDGPFGRLNSEIIEGGGTTDVPRYYTYADDTLDPCTAYYYYVESISLSGERKRFTPIGLAPPKISPQDAEEGTAGESSCGAKTAEEKAEES